MSRLIDADELKKKAFGKRGGLIHTADIDAMPTIEERKTGWWIPQDHNKTNGMASTLVYYYPKCSVCGHCANYTNFCPNCGARMVQEGEDNGLTD